MKQTNTFFFIALLSISASVFSMQEFRHTPLIPPGDSAPSYQQLPQQDDSDESETKNTEATIDLENLDKAADEAVETKAEKPEKKKEKQTVSCSTGKKVRITTAVMILLAAVSGMVSDSITINYHRTPSSRLTCFTSIALFLYVNVEVRAMTKRPRIRDKVVRMSSVIPSAKNSCSGSALMLANGNTAIDGTMGNSRDGSARAEAGGTRLD